jgi:hypothetical protein
MPSVVTYIITVDDDHRNAVVTSTPRTPRLKRNQHNVVFKSNDERTVIRYRETSPFGQAEVGPLKELKIGASAAGKGPFLAVTPGNLHHFDCGFISGVDQSFQVWGGTQGADTPVDP